MEWAIGIAVVVGLIGAGYLFVVSQFRSKPVFLATYRNEMNLGGRTPQGALEKAMRMFTRRPPFEQFTDNQIKYIASVCGQMDNPEELAEVWLDADKQRNPNLVRSFAFFVDFERHLSPDCSVEGAIALAMRCYMDGVPWFATVTDEDVSAWAQSFRQYPAAVGAAIAEADDLRNGALLKDRVTMYKHFASTMAGGFEPYR